MMKAWYPVLLIILFLQAEPATGLQADSGFIANESDSTEGGLILRSQDLFWQTGYHPVSLDRISFMLDSHIYGRYGPSPDFYADGIPFDPSFFDMTFTQLIPLPVHQLKQKNRASARGGGIREGKPYGAGIMEFFSEPIKNGLSISAAGQVGHNSGEPGPWAFDPNRVSPNVERFGPWVDAAASLRLGNWYTRGVLRTNSSIYVDEFVQNRLLNLQAIPETGEYLRPEASSMVGLVETGILNRRLSIRIQGLRSEGDNYLFFQPVAREVPTTMESSQISGFLHAKLNDRFGLRSLVQVRKKELGYRPHRFTQNFDWRQELLLARSSFYFKSDQTTAELGAELENIRIEAVGMSGYRNPYRKGFFQLKQSVTGSLRFEGEGRITVLKDYAAYSGSAAVYLDLTKRWQAGVRGHYNELLPEKVRPLDEWVINGYSIFDLLGIQGLYVSQGEKSRSREVSTIQKVNISDKLTVDLEIGWVENTSMQIPFQYAAYNFPFSTEPGTYLLHQNEGGRRLTGNLMVQYQPSDRMRHSAVLYMNRVEHGSRLYRLYWKSTPEISVQYSVDYNLFRDMEIQVKTQYVSEREWPEFERIDGRLNRTFYVQYPFRFYTFENDLPAHLNIDLTVAKWFWDQRLRAVILIKNVLNRHYQTHPLGIREGFGYLLRLEVRL